MSWPSRRSEEGLTLIELIVTIAIMGVSVIALVAGLGSAVAGSSQQRRRAATDVVLRTAAEDVRAAVYGDCTASYPVPSPAGFSVIADVVGHWNPDPVLNRFEPPPCPGGSDFGLQLIEITVSSSDGRVTEKAEVVKRR